MFTASVHFIIGNYLFNIKYISYRWKAGISLMPQSCPLDKFEDWNIFDKS